MKDHFENNRPRMTDAERRHVWERIREGRQRGTLLGNWRVWSPAAAGALAVLILALVLIDKTPPWKAEMPSDMSAQAPAAMEMRDRAVDLVITADSTLQGAERRQGSAERSVAEVGANEAKTGEAGAPAGDTQRALAKTSSGDSHNGIAESSPPELHRDVDGSSRDSQSDNADVAPAAPPMKQEAERSSDGLDAPRSHDARAFKPDTGAEPTLDSTWGAIKNLPADVPAAPKPEENDEAVASSVPPAGAADSGAGEDVAGALGSEGEPQMPEVTIVTEKERIKTKRTDTSHDLTAKDLENLPVNEIAEAIRLKAGVIARGGELHFRGGRAGEVNVTADGVPVKDPLLGAGQDSPGAGSATFDRDGSANNSADSKDEPVIEAPDAMFFQDYGANPLQLADRDGLSTFAVDVDGGAYTLARNYIERGELPDRAAPRVEEFVNYFSGGYPTFDDQDFRIYVDGAPSPFGPGFQLVRVGIKARTIADEDRRPSRLTFVIDVSGSMEREDRLGLVKRALHLLVNELEEDDRVGIVVYGSNGRVVLESVSAAQRERILEAIDSLAPDGSTNAEEGLLLAYQMAHRNFDPGANNRIVLCSDGVANVGRTGPEAILEQVRTEADRGIYLTTVGFGMGNYNDVLMEQLANGGDGAYYYVDDLDEARRVFVDRLTGTLQIVARDAKVQVEFDPEQVMAYRLLGFENRAVADQDFRNDEIDAGEIGSGHEVTALYEVRFQDGVRAERTRGGFATVRFRYELPPDGDRTERTLPFGAAGRNDRLAQQGTPVDQDRTVREIAHEIDLGNLSRSFDDASPRLHLAAAAAEFAEILRQSYWAKESSIGDLVPLARRIASKLRDDAEAEGFARLVEKAAWIEEHLAPDQVAERARVRERQRAVTPYYP